MMRPATLFLAGALASGLAGCQGTQVATREEPASGTPSFYRSLAATDAVVDAAAARDMISQYRRNNGLDPVTLDPALATAALAQSRAMAAANTLSHEVRGSFDSRVQAAGVKGLAVENVSAGYHTLAEAFSGWRASAPHNKNLLAKGVHRMGIAAAYAPGTRYKVFWTLVMAD